MSLSIWASWGFVHFPVGFQSFFMSRADIFQKKMRWIDANRWCRPNDVWHTACPWRTANHWGGPQLRTVREAPLLLVWAYQRHAALQQPAAGRWCGFGNASKLSLGIKGGRADATGGSYWAGRSPLKSSSDAPSVDVRQDIDVGWGRRSVSPRIYLCWPRARTVWHTFRFALHGLQKKRTPFNCCLLPVNY